MALASSCEEYAAGTGDSERFRYGVGCSVWQSSGEDYC